MDLKFKRIISAVLVLTMCFGFASCSFDSNESENENETSIITDSIESTESDVESTDETESDDESSSQSQTTSPSTTKKSSDGSTSTKSTTATTKKSSKSKTTSSSEKTTTSKSKSTSSKVCYLSVECSEILEGNNINNLASGHSKYVPDDGYIIKNYKYKISNDSTTVYDVLKKACADNDIILTAENSQFGTYVSGINNIDEKDCGEYSGWMYKVNSVYPSVSCGKYTVKSGDVIEFTYTVTYN